MSATLKELKIKLAKLAKDFSDEENIFQRSLPIFKFIEILQKNKETKKTLDSLLSETSKAMNCERLSDEDDLLCEKAGIDCDFWVCYGALDKVHTLITKFKDTQDKRYADKAVKMITASYYPEIYRICFKMVAGCLLEKMALAYTDGNLQVSEVLNSSGSTSASSYTHYLTVPAGYNDNYLLCYWNTSGRAVQSSLTYNGVAMTNLGQISIRGDSSYVYGLKNVPINQGNKPLVLNFTTSSYKDWYISCVAVSNIYQANPIAKNENTAVNTGGGAWFAGGINILLIPKPTIR